MTLLQTEDYDLPSAMEHLKNRKDFSKDLRSDTALNEMLCDAREFADEIDIPSNFELTQPHKVINAIGSRIDLISTHNNNFRFLNNIFDLKDTHSKRRTKVLLRSRNKWHFTSLPGAANLLAPALPDVQEFTESDLVSWIYFQGRLTALANWARRLALVGGLFSFSIQS
ncbi:UNVERIFIED_CONTAM: hypothetical protein NCL1_50922 [Trichonephila clavipes]